MKIGPSNEKLAFEKYEKLKLIHEQAGGVSLDKLLVSSDDAKTRAILDKTKRVDSDLSRYKNSCNSSPSAKARRFFGRSGIPADAKSLVDKLEEVLGLIIKTTQQRGEHKLLSPLAFHPSLESIDELTTAHTFMGTWIVDFKQKDNSSGNSCHVDGSHGADTSGTIDLLLKRFGLTPRALYDWWRSHHLDRHSRETVIWNDMRAMARKVVFILDYCVDIATMAEPDFDAFCECVAEGRRIAISIVRLVDLCPNRVEKIRPCVELFIPSLFVLSECMERLRHRRSEILDILIPVIQRLKSNVDCLGGKLLANQQPDALEHDNVMSGDVLAELPISEQVRSELLASGLIRDPSQLSETLKGVDNDISRQMWEVVAKRIQRGRTHSAHSIQELKRLGLDKIELEERPCGRLGSGSYGRVSKYNSQDCSRQQYAVKIFRRSDKSFDEKRIWNHIIREAENWCYIDHKNINKLVGFCTFKDSIYPGLVMDVCEENLSEYCSMKSSSAEDRLNFMLDVASGLQYLHDHKNGYAHGDLRPENVLINNPKSALRPFAVITDFGVADMTEVVFNRISISTDGQRAPEEYLAPEFCTNLPDCIALVSSKADMYAFGCVFAVIVCEAVLYEKPQNKMRRLKERGEFPVTSENISDKKYWRLLCNLWDKNPERRLNALSVVGVLREFIIAIRASHACT